MRLFLLAARNLRRNRRRTLITMAAIAFGLGMMIWAINLGNGSYQAAIRSGVSMLAGHVVIQAEGYQDERDETLLVTDVASLSSQLAGAFPDAIVVRRIFLSGLVTSANGSVGGALEGVDPVNEGQVNELDDKIVEGEWLADDDLRGLVLGVGMAQTLGVEVGDKVVYMGQHGTEEVASRLFRVRGIYRTGAIEVDGFMAVAHHDAVTELLAQQDVTHQLSLHIPDPDLSEQIHREVEALISPDGREILWWREALPELWAVIKLDKEMNNNMMAVLGIIVMMGVLNTVLMSVMERTREFGVLMAIGMRPHKLALMVLCEGLVLGAMSSVLGLAFGALMTWPTVIYGIDYTEYMGETTEFAGVAISSVMKAAWDVPRMTGYTIFAVIFTGLTAAWPAWVVSRLTPMDALRRQ